MQIHRVRVPDYKGVHLDIPWAPAMVLFGANDSGKTNVLEAFLSEFGPDGSVRQQPARLDVRTGFDVELDGLDIEGHHDQEIFLGWFLSGNSHTSWWPIGDDFVDDHRDVLIELDTSLGYARIEYAGLPWGDERPRAVADLARSVRDTVREVWDALLTLGVDIADLGVRSVGEAVRSRHFRVEAYRVEWLSPGPDASPYAVVLATELGGPPRDRRHGVDSLIEPTGISVIPIGPAADALATLRDRLEVLLPRLSERLGGPEIWPSFAVRDGGMAKDGSGDAWVLRQGDLYGLRPSMLEACRDLSRRVNELAPPFVSASYEIEIAPLLPDEWAAAGGRHIAVRLRTREQDLTFDPELASSGIATWTNLAISEAIRVAEKELAQREPRSPDALRGAGPTVYVFDEPETHLHPLAQEQAATWVAERVRDGATVLIASHAVPFLDLPLPDLEVFQVARTGSWETQIRRISGDVMGAVREAAESMGLPPVALMQLTRAWLVVEGEHDRKIIEAFHGRALRAAGIRILVLRGAANAKASFLTFSAYEPLRIPFFFLFDNTLAPAARGDRRAAGRSTEEERIAEQVSRLGETEGNEVHVLGLRDPDIVCALPIEAVRQVARENKKGQPEAASSWSDLIGRFEERRCDAEARGEKAPHFKQFALETLGLVNMGVDRLVDEALLCCKGQPPEPSELSRHVKEIVARVSAVRSPLPAPLGDGQP